MNKKHHPLDALKKQVKKSINKYPTVEQFCWATGLSKATISNFLKDKKDFQISTLIKIAKAVKKQLIVKLK